MKIYEAPPGFVLNPDYLVPELRAQRDALLEALKAMADEFVKVYPVYYASEPWAHERNKTLQLARAAIAKAEGEEA